MTSPRHLKKWEDNFKKLDQCPWPGPRPLDEKDGAARCIGRERDASDLVLTIKEHRLVILSGDSGVGKSSLVNVKLMASLRGAGYTPIICKKWSKEGGHDFGELDAASQGQAVIRRKLLDSLEESGAGVSIGDCGDLGRDLDDAFGGLAVVVLDQFEELIRYQPGIFESVAEWILKTNKTSRVRIVLSLRSEYAHRLRDIEQSAAPFSLHSIVLKPITKKAHIQQLIENARLDEGGGKPISPEAASMILDRWQQLPNDKSRATSGKWHNIGLLHLQATLYSLHALAKAVDKSTVEAAHVERFLQECEANLQEGEVKGSAKSFFDHGLREAVRRKLMLCEEACETREEAYEAGRLNLDRTLVEGTKAAAYRMIPHLSSGGYKLERDAWDLAELALDRELEQLVRNKKGPSESSAKSVYLELAAIDRADPDGDLLTISRRDVIRRVPAAGISETERAAEGEGLEYDVAAWDCDPTDASAGPLLGFNRGDVLIEEIRRVVFAQHWLDAAQLVRKSSAESVAGVARTMLSLTHDAFADALEYWARFRRPAPADALYLLTAAKGRTFDWRDHAGPHSQLSGKLSESGRPTYATLINLRWQDCRVSANFRWVAFVNCDFTGTRFKDCVFEGVSFVNCLLDKASFEECDIVGAVSHIAPNKSQNVIDGTPSFKVKADTAKVIELQKYRRDTVLGDVNPIAQIFSRTSGVSAMLWNERYDGYIESQGEEGGLTMYGGRLSSLMIRACKFDKNGQLGFRFIAGSALDIVETSDCDIDIVSSAIRGLTITRGTRDSTEPNVKVQVNDSSFANCWFGDQLKGRAFFADCQILQLFNLSNAGAFQVEITNSLNDGVRNASGQLQNQRDANWMADESVREKVAGNVEKMDYRSQPAKILFAKSRGGELKH